MNDGDPAKGKIPGNMSVCSQRTQPKQFSCAEAFPCNDPPGLGGDLITPLYEWFEEEYSENSCALGATAATINNLFLAEHVVEEQISLAA